MVSLVWGGVRWIPTETLSHVRRCLACGNRLQQGDQLWRNADPLEKPARLCCVPADADVEMLPDSELETAEAHG